MEEPPGHGADVVEELDRVDRLLFGSTLFMVTSGSFMRFLTCSCRTTRR
jgi:hypothetical protein